MLILFEAVLGIGSMNWIKVRILIDENFKIDDISLGRINNRKIPLEINIENNAIK